MYDEWYDVPDPTSGLEDRVTHLVFVGGRLVDSWTEHAADSRWGAYVARPAPPPPPPAPPVHVQVLERLAEMCGGAEALAGLGDEPLTPSPRDPAGAVPDRAVEERLATTADLLDDVADRCFDAETGIAFRNALRALWVEDPDSAMRPSTAAHLAGGICWAVGKANALFHPAGPRRVGTVQEHLGLPAGLSGHGNQVALALRGFRGRRIEPWPTPYGVPDLLVLARTDVLLASTRVRLLRLRDRAEAAAAA